MGRLKLIEYDIPTDPNHSFVYACINPTCRTHFVLQRLAPDFPRYYTWFHAVYFQELVVNLVTDENENPIAEHNMVTKDLHCVKCNDKVGLKLITKNPDGIVIDERDLLLVNQLVVFTGQEGPQPQHITGLQNFLIHPQAAQQADPQANPLQPPPPAN